MEYILVTGGLGFIGSHLASALLEDPNVTVHVVDNLSGCLLPADDVVADMTRGKPGTLHVHTLSVADFEPRVPFKTIYHLASIVGPAGVLGHAGYITESIVNDTYRMIRLAQSCDARLVNVSTSEVYGGGKDGFCDEETPRIIRPVASARLEYAAGKLATEVAIENLCNRGTLDAVTIRPCNVAGVRQLGTGGFVLPRFVGQAILGRPLTVFGDGSQVRAFTDVRDVVTGILLVAAQGECGGVYNVGNPANRVSIRDLAERVLAITGSSAGVSFVDPRTIYGEQYAEAEDKFPNASRLMQLGWQPQYSLDDTIRAVHDWLSELPREVCTPVAGLE